MGAAGSLETATIILSYYRPTPLISNGSHSAHSYTPHPTSRIEQAIRFDPTVASPVPDTMDHLGFLVDECVIEDNLKTFYQERKTCRFEQLENVEQSGEVEKVQTSTVDKKMRAV